LEGCLELRIGLVLGGGGFVGGAWLTGALEALEDCTGALPPRFDQVVGTSAGAMIGALTSSGVHPTQVAALFSGRGPGANGATAVHPAGARLRLEPGLPRLVPGSVRLALSALRNPRNHRPGVALAAFLPRGLLSTEPLKDMVRTVVRSGWSPHPGLWVVACDLATGRRVSFGRADAPRAHLVDAVAASCAIPGFYAPVGIGGTDYVDGGCWSPSNLDVLRKSELDLVVCFNPTSSVERTGARRITERIGDAYRGAFRAQLDREATRMRVAGTGVLLVEPTAADLVVMGNNMMSSGRLDVVSEVARRSVARQLESPKARALVRALTARSAPAPASTAA
jgi:NTE family protein